VTYGLSNCISLTLSDRQGHLALGALLQLVMTVYSSRG